MLLVSYCIKLLAILTGFAVIFIPLLSYHHIESNISSHSSGTVSCLLRWPTMLVLTIIYLAIGITLWRPLPISLSVGMQLSVLIIGSLLYFPGIILYLWGYKTLGRMFGFSSGFGASLYKDHKLIQSGPYRYVRHPMYLAVILAAIGALLIFRTWAMTLFSIMSFGVILRARQEERLLAEEFGRDWESYKRDVNGWLPTFRKRVK